jgi:hypothetical protein
VPPVSMDVRQAVNSAKDGKIFLGTASELKKGGEPYAIWDTEEAAQIGVFGANGTGKTKSVAAMAVLTAIRWKWHVLILDPKRGADWRLFEPYVERYDSGAEEMTGQLRQLADEVERRQLLCSERSVGHVNDLPSAERPVPILLILEELGATRAQLASVSGKQLARLDRYLSDIMRVSRYVGVKVLLIDQRPENWPPAVKANLKALITFRQGMHQGNVVGYYFAHTLNRVGQFALDGVVYDAFYAHNVARQFLANAAQGQPADGHIMTWKGAQYRKLLTGVIPAASLAEPSAARALYEATAPAPVTTTEAGGGEKSPKELVFSYLDENPSATQADVRRAFNLNPNQAHRYFHAYHAEEAE